MKFITCRTRGCGRSIEEDFHVLETLYLLVFRHTHDAFTQLLMTTRKRERFAASRSTSIIRSKSSMIFYRSSKWTLSLFMILVFVQYYFFSVDLLGHVFFTLMITIEFWLFIYIFFFFFSCSLPIQIITSSSDPLSFRLPRFFAWHAFPIFRIVKHRKREEIVNAQEIFVRFPKFAFKRLSIRNATYIRRYILFVYVANTRIYPYP